VRGARRIAESKRQQERTRSDAIRTVRPCFSIETAARHAEETSSTEQATDSLARHGRGILYSERKLRRL
jgi:hypothetical protein